MAECDLPPSIPCCWSNGPNDRELLGIIAWELCQVLHTGIAPSGNQDVNILSSVVLDVSGSVVALDAATIAALEPIASTSDDRSNVGFLYLDGLAGSKATTPDAATLDIVGDIDIRVAAWMADWTPTATDTLIGKWQTGQKSYAFSVFPNGTLLLSHSVDGSTNINDFSTVATGFSNGTLHLVRVTLDVDDGAGGHTATFYTKETVAENAYADMREDSGWTQLGAAVTTAGITSIFSGTAVFTVGSLSDDTAPVQGRIYGHSVQNGINGTLVASVDWSDPSQWFPSATSGIGDTGLIYTIAGGAEIRGIGVANQGAPNAGGSEAWPVSQINETFTKKSPTATASGNNTLHTPAGGKKIRLYFFGYSAGANVTGVLAGLRFGAAGTIFDQQYLVTPGQPHARNIQAGKRYVDGAVNEELILNLSGAQTVYVNLELDEITP